LIVANPRQTKIDRYASYKIRYPYGDEAATVLSLIGGESEAAKAFAEAENGIVLFGSDGTGLTSSRSLAQACANLVIETNHTGRANNGLIGVWAKANEQGAWDMGFRPIEDLSATLESAKALYVAAADPVGDDPALAEVVEALDFVMVQELFLTETAKLADVVLPVQAQTEREGTFTSGERRVQRFYPVTRPKGAALADFDIAAQIGERLDIDLKGRSPSLVMLRIRETIPGYEEITYQKLAEVTEQWPIVGREDLYYGGTSYANKQGLGTQLAPQGKLESSSVPETRKIESGELIAVPITRLYDRGRMVMPSHVLHPRLPEPFIAINPEDARRQKAADGMTVNIRLNGTTGCVVIREDQTVPSGVALVPRSMGFPITEPTAIEILIAEPATT
jgi:NADH-quinone oxidoreductase subunit G